MSFRATHPVGRRAAVCWIAFAVVGAIQLFALGAAAQEPVFEMRPATEVVDDGLQPQVIGGRWADPQFWPNTFVFENPEGGACTSTQVGSQVILTAAHCVADGAIGRVSIGGRHWRLVCDHHPDYDGAASEDDPDSLAALSSDWALCHLDRATNNSAFERIDARGDHLRPDAPVRLLGYGCNQRGGSDNGFGVLFEGDSKIAVLPSPPNAWTETRGGAALCYGDSGGGAYVLLDSAGNYRLLMGVNSRGDLTSRSLLSTTSTSEFLSWARTWAAEREALICGLHGEADGCRAEAP